VEVLRSPDGVWWKVQAKNMVHGGRIHLVGSVRVFPPSPRPQTGTVGPTAWEYKSLCGTIWRGGEVVTAAAVPELPVYSPEEDAERLCLSCARCADMRDMGEAEAAVRLLDEYGIHARMLGPNSVLLYANQVQELIKRLQGGAQ